MNKITNRIKGLFNKYTILLLLTYFVFGVGFSYAYFAFQEEDASTIVGNVVAINATLDVELVVGNTGKMVPMLNGALGNALNGSVENGACIDSAGNLSCQVYKITLTNNGSRLQHITGTVELYAKDGAGNVYNNLRWQELENTTTIKTGSVVNKMSRSALVIDITLESGEPRTWYIAVWISERDYDQTNTDKGQFGGTVTFEVLGANFNNGPNLDNGNLLPVYFDENEGTYGSWMKADSTNENNSWYDYSNKMWANAVIIDPDATTDYSEAAIGDPVADSDIIAFYVWIPRYKYRVWNLNRQGITEDTTAEATNTIYAYPAFTNGIDIEFEYFEGATGNVECIYDTTTQEDEDNLSDKCYYNGSTTPIATTDLNTNYTDAWYTHPAFTFGGEEKEGFWIGKFETSTDTSSICYTNPSGTNCNNTNQNSRILPDVASLRYQNVSNKFTASKKFQNYLSSEIDAHMLTNLEWGAVAYLAHSMYGLCNDNNGTVTCTGVNNNNSSGFYTGRSSGAIADGTSSKYGTYDYKGYSLDSTGVSTTKESITLVASTTKNVTGVYDMSGGAEEYVMGNMVDSSNNFYPYNAVSSGVTNPWNESNILDSKYYNSYSYGTSYEGKEAIKRARLGDATAEVLGGITQTSAWKPGSGITGSNSRFMNRSNSWFYRGGDYDNAGSGVFKYNSSNGFSTINSNANAYYSFRSSLS